MLFSFLFYVGIISFIVLISLKIKIAWLCLSVAILAFGLNILLFCFDQAKEFLSNIKGEVNTKDHI
jgi:hypothetical protein